jgi:hypothetical protein
MLHHFKLDTTILPWIEEPRPVCKPAFVKHLASMPRGLHRLGRSVLPTEEQRKRAEALERLEKQKTKKNADSTFTISKKPQPPKVTYTLSSSDDDDALIQPRAKKVRRLEETDHEDEKDHHPDANPSEKDSDEEDSEEEGEQGKRKGAAADLTADDLRKTLKQRTRPTNSSTLDREVTSKCPECLHLHCAVWVVQLSHCACARNVLFVYQHVGVWQHLLPSRRRLPRHHRRCPSPRRMLQALTRRKTVMVRP